MLRPAMEAYPYVFHPVTVLAIGIIAVVYLEWRRQDAGRGFLWRRIGGFLGAGVLSLVPTGAYLLTTGSAAIGITRGNAWQVDALVASGLLIAAGVTWWLWQRYDWGGLVPDAVEALAAVTVPYIALSPVWIVSGHVIIALMPALFLTLFDRRFWPALLVPVVMVPNRVYLGAHTWTQSIGGFLIAAAVVLGVRWVQTEGWPRGNVATEGEV